MHLYDVLLVSSSWETRSLSVLRLKSSHRFRIGFIFRYRHKKVEQLEEASHRILSSELQQCCDKVWSAEIDLWDPVDALKHVRSALRTQFGADESLRILFDVSTITKAHMLTLLRYLDEPRLRNEIDLFYTDLVSPHIGSPSRGVSRIIVLPLFGTHVSPDLDRLLVTFVGFEPERVVALWEHLEPNLTIPIYSLRRDGKSPLRSDLLHDQLLSRPGVAEAIQVNALDPPGVAASLREIVQSYIGRYNICIGVVGNKLQAIGLYIFIRVNNPNIQLVYPVPQAYKKEYWNPDKVGSSRIYQLTAGFAETLRIETPFP